MRPLTYACPKGAAAQAPSRHPPTMDESGSVVGTEEASLRDHERRKNLTGAYLKQVELPLEVHFVLQRTQYTRATPSPYGRNFRGESVLVALEIA